MVLKLQGPDDKTLERWFRSFRHLRRQDFGAVVLKITRRPRYLIADKRRKKIREKIFEHCCTIGRILLGELRDTEWATEEFASAWPEVFMQ